MQARKLLAFCMLAACAVLMCTAAWAASPIKVAKKGAYVYWFTYKDAAGAEQTTLPQRFKGRSAQLDTRALGEKPSNVRLHVMDRKTGNMAITDFPPEGQKPIELAADAFQYVRSVRLRIVSEDGKPVEAAIVNISDGEGRAMRALVTPADQGVASFSDVASGEINVKVQAKGLRKTIDSDIELPEKRSRPDFERDIKVAGDVDTVAGAARAETSGGEQPGGASAREPTPAPAGSILLQLLAGLIFIAVVIAILVAVLRSKGVTAETALKKMGVQVPGAQAPDQVSGTGAAPAVDPNVCEFCGQRKDAAGRCACTVTPGESPSAAPAPSAAGGPRLIGTQGVYAGHIFEISGASVVIGREAGNGVALVNDSTASRRHATLTVADGAYTIRDEGSSNGTFVNGARITQQRLAPGDEIQIGGTKFRFEA